MQSVLLVLVLCVAVSLVQTQRAAYFGEIRVPNVDLLNTFTHTNPPNNRVRYSILAGTYSPDRATYDPAVVLIHPGNYMLSNFSSYTGSHLFNFLFYPKEVTQIPRSVIGHDAVLMPDGSTFPAKTEGSLYAADVSDINFPTTFDIGERVIPVPENIMYHSGVWFQVDADNRDDLVTCRVELEGNLIRRAQLVWLGQPIGGLRARWTLDVLKEAACDSNLAHAHFRSGPLNQDDVVYATGFHTQRLTVFWSEGRNWDIPAQIEGRVIDIGRQFYDVVVVDVNNNGDLELLVTSVAQSGGVVEVWQIPSDFKDILGYTRRVIASGFVARNAGVNGRTPKVARPFFPTSNVNRKPWILVAGGDDGRAYYLRPVSEQPGNWEYELVTVADHGVNQVVGGMTSADIDGDGNTELFVSVHNKNVVEVYTFGPVLDQFVYKDTMEAR